MLTDGNPTVWGPTGVRAPDVSGGAAGGSGRHRGGRRLRQRGEERRHAHHQHRHRAPNLPVDNLTAISGPGDAFTTASTNSPTFLRTARDGGVPGHGHGRQGGPGQRPDPVHAGRRTGRSRPAPPTVTPTSGTTAPATGAVNFAVDFSASATEDGLVRRGAQTRVEPRPTMRASTPDVRRRPHRRRASSNTGPTGFTRHASVPTTSSAAWYGTCSNRCRGSRSSSR